VKKNRTMVIFLTDGALGIDDIPIPDEITEGGSNQGGKPVPPSRETEKIGDEDESDNEDEGSQSGGSIVSDPEDHLNEYLEEYKAELFELCYEYQRDDIRIFPIAFTDEANTDILEEIALITHSRMWKAQDASDIRDIFLDIFKYMTGIFITVYPQEGREPIEGSIPVEDHVKNLAVIAVTNENTKKPDIELYEPFGDTNNEITVIIEPTYIINAVNGPDKGEWKYRVDGDMVLAMDLARVVIIDPLKAVYFMDSKVPVMIQLSMPENIEGTIEYSDFEIFCEIFGPEQASTGRMQMIDDGIGIDGAKGDGIFSYSFEDINETGDHKIEFTMTHKPTGSSSFKEKIFTVTDYQPVKKEIYLKIENNIIAGSPVKIYANLEDLSPGMFTYTVTSPDGKTTSGELYDNGSIANDDSEAGDGIYSNILEGFLEIGEYAIELRADYKSAEDYELYQIRETEISKYVEIEVPGEIFEIDPDSRSLKIMVGMTSEYDSDLQIGLGSREADENIIENIETDYSILKAGSDIDMQMTIYFRDDITEGEYNIDIPLVLEQVFIKNIELKSSYKAGSFELDHRTLIGLIVIFLSLVPLIFLLYAIISLRRRDIKLIHPKVIAGSAVFLLLLIAGLIIIFI